MPLAKKNKKEKKSKRRSFFWAITGAILFLIIFTFLLVSQPPLPELAAEMIDGKVKIDSVIQIKFNWPVARQVELNLTPEVYGDHIYSDTWLEDHLSKAIIFTPELNWKPDTTYEITVANVQSSFFSFWQPKQYSLVFTTESMPVINSVLPDQEQVINPDMQWEISLDKANTNFSDYEFDIKPIITTQISLSQDKEKYIVKPVNLLSQGQIYSLTVQQKRIRYYFGTEEIAYQADPEIVWQGSWQVREAPGISSYEPQGNNVALDSVIRFSFDENIDLVDFKEKVIIEPELTGQWTTEDYETVIFTSEHNLAQNTDYAVIIKAGLKTFAGGYFEEDSIHTFTTTGPARLAGSSPSNGGQGISINSLLRFSFDKTVDHASAQSKFIIAPVVGGTFNWESNAMIFYPAAPLDFNTTYIVTLGSGISSSEGFASEQEYKITFSTEVSVTKLDVPFHRQEHNLSCEIATLVMALAFHGVNVSEATLVEAIGVDPTPKQDGVWGNPHIAFVGDIDGKQPSTGYGVYWQPIVQAAQAYRVAEWFTGWSITDLTNEIKNGNPVIVWGTAGSGSRIDWKTSDGGNVVAVNGEHTRIVTGFIGSADNPSKIITLDPLSGEKYFTKSSFEWNWGLLNNSGVVVR